MNLEPIVNPAKQQLRSTFFNRGDAIPRSWKPNIETATALNTHVSEKLAAVATIDSLNHVVVSAASTLSARPGKQGRQ